MPRRTSALVLAAILLFSTAAAFGPGNTAFDKTGKYPPQSSSPGMGRVPLDATIDRNVLDVTQGPVTSIVAPAPSDRRIIFIELRCASFHIDEFAQLASTIVEHLHAFRI